MERYYKTNIKALPVGLVWSWGSPLSFLAFLIRKVLPFPAYGPLLVCEELNVVEVQESTADAHLAAMMAPHRSQLEVLGFRSTLLYQVPTLGAARDLSRALLSADQRALCLLLSARMGQIAQVATAITSIANDGRMVGTSSAVLRLPPVPGIDIDRLPGAPADAVARHHLNRLGAFPAKRLEPTDVVPFLREHQQRGIEYYVAKGLYVLANERDIARARAG
jgi:hypothetical protein